MTQVEHVLHALGAYVLGGLDGDERRSVEVHVANCEGCRDELARLSGMPALLDRLTADEVMMDLRPVVANIRPGLADAVATADRSLRRRLTHWRRATAVASAVAVVALVAHVVPLSGSDPLREPLVLELEAVSADAGDVDGTVSAYAWEWGTTVEIDVAGLPQRSSYVLWTVGEDGERQTAGMWGPTQQRGAEVRGASAIQRDRLQAVEVRDASGDLLLAASLTGE